MVFDPHPKLVVDRHVKSLSDRSDQCKLLRKSEFEEHVASRWIDRVK